MLSTDELTAIASGTIPTDASALLETCELHLLAAGACAIATKNGHATLLIDLDAQIAARVIQFCSRAIYGAPSESFIARVRGDPRWGQVSARLPERAIASLCLRLKEFL